MNNSSTIPQIAIQVNPRGEIKGDTSHIAPEMLAQLQTPESKAKFRQMYKEQNGGGRRETRRQITPQTQQRNFTDMKPAGMSSKEYSKIRRIYFRKMRKAALRGQRRSYGQSFGN